MKTRATAIVALTALVAWGCQPTAGASVSPPVALCADLPGEDVQGLDWATDASSIVVRSQEVAASIDVRRDRIRLLDPQTLAWTDILATREFLGPVTAGPSAEAIWGQAPSETFVILRAASTDEPPMELLKADHLRSLAWTSGGLVLGIRPQDEDLVLRLRSNDGEIRDLLTTPHGDNGTWVSPDGKWIVFSDVGTRTTPDIITVRHDGIDSSPMPVDRYSMLWGMTTDRTAVMYSVVDTETLEFSGLFKLSVDGGESAPVSLGLAIGSLALSSDGRIAYSGFRVPESSQVCIIAAIAVGL